MLMARVCGGDSPRRARHIERMNIPILILAAGQSTRMRGADKLMQPIDGAPLLSRVASMACAASDDAVFVALPPKPHPRWSALDGLNVNRLAVPDAKEGLNASLRAGVAKLPSDCDAVMVLLADLPNLTKIDIRHVLQSVDFKRNDLIWRGSTEDGKPGHPVVFHHKIFPELCALTGDSGAQSVVRRHIKQVKLISLPQQNARLDLDTPEDWEKWRRSQTP
jgi:molybdenum cofactor cytidylyltransferase